jgi:hypothetical protein
MAIRHHRHRRGGSDGVDKDGRSGNWPLHSFVAAWPTMMAAGAPSHALSPVSPEGGGAVKEGGAKTMIGGGGGGGMGKKMGLQRQQQN